MHTLSPDWENSSIYFQQGSSATRRDVWWWQWRPGWLVHSPPPSTRSGAGWVEHQRALSLNCATKTAPPLANSFNRVTQAQKTPDYHSMETSSPYNSSHCPSQSPPSQTPATLWWCWLSMSLGARLVRHWWLDRARSSAKSGKGWKPVGA